MNINADAVINTLGAKVANLEVQLAVAKAQIDQLQKEIAEAQKEDDA